MKYDVTFTEQAENDLRGIFEYIAFELLSPENAPSFPVLTPSFLPAHPHHAAATHRYACSRDLRRFH